MVTPLAALLCVVLYRIIFDFCFFFVRFGVKLSRLSQGNNQLFYFQSSSGHLRIIINNLIISDYTASGGGY